MKVLFFDGNCLLCTNFTFFLIKLDKRKILKFSLLGSDFAKEKFLDAPEKIKQSDSVIFLEEGVFYEKSTAVLKIFKALGFPFLFFYFFIIIPSFLRDFVYDFMAKNRYSFFRKSKKCDLRSYSFLKERII